jgi:hypothetical protein
MLFGCCIVSPPVMQRDERVTGTHGFYRFERYSEISVRSGPRPGRSKSKRVGDFAGFNIPAHRYSELT